MPEEVKKVEREKKIEPRLGDKIPENIIKRAEKEILSKYKTVKVGNLFDKENVEVFIYKPTPRIESLASDEFTRVYNKLIKNPDILTTEEMEKIVKERELWTDGHEEKIKNAQEDMRDIELIVANMRKKGKYSRKKMQELRAEWNDKRKIINDLLEKKTSLFSNTIEGRAKEAEMKTQLALCCKYPEGELVWDSLDSLNDTEDRVAVIELMNEAMLFWVGLSQEIIQDLPAEIIFGREGVSEK